jgi:acyl carrier protein
MSTVDGAIRTSASREDRMVTEGSLTGAGTGGGLFDEIVGILLEVTRESAEWAVAITPNARLEVDLGMESIELLALAELLRSRYGDAVDLPAFVAGLDIDRIIGLSVGDVVEFVAARRAAGPPPGPGGAAAAEPVMPSVARVMPGQPVGGGA